MCFFHILIWTVLILSLYYYEDIKTYNTIHTYFKVTMRHIADSHWQVLILVTHKWHEAGNNWAYMYNENTSSGYETYKLYYTTSIHPIQCYRHLLVYLINLYSYLDSLRQVHCITSPYHLYKVPLFGRPDLSLARSCQTITLPYHNIMLCSRVCMWCWGFC